MTDDLHDLLEQGVLGVRLKPHSREAVTLPEVFEHLGRNDVYAFTALQAHQQHAWYAFLVQLATIALEASGEPEGIWPDHERWKELLLELTDGFHEPWSLVVEDLARPAFMQPPVSEGTLKKFKTIEFPDAMDVLITAKNHDLKHSRIRHPDPEHWLYALVSLQTMQGFLGSGNYGIARMNGGFASRPCVGYAPGISWGARFRRDVTILRRSRGQMAADHHYPERGGLALLWLEPWDGAESLSLERCDPLFIEICRRVRFASMDGQLHARVTGSKVQRLLAKESKGDLGDPWTPVKKAEGIALTVSATGFSYKLTQELLLSADYSRGVSQGIYTDDPDDLMLQASVLVRGQGQTDGLHERQLPVPPKVKAMLGSIQGRETLGAIAKRRVEDAALVQKSLLRPALLALLQAAPEKLDFKDNRTRPWISSHDAAVDGVFFEHLWRDVEESNEAEDARWQRAVIALARVQLEDAMQSIPVPAARRYRALAAAERFFRGAMYKHFADAMETTKEVTP